jgi:hypothetical protein
MSVPVTTKVTDLLPQHISVLILAIQAYNLDRDPNVCDNPTYRAILTEAHRQLEQEILTEDCDAMTITVTEINAT